MPDVQILIEGGTNVIDLKKLRNELLPKGDPNEYPKDADVICEEIVVGGVAIAGTENLPMDYVAGTDGKKTTYRAIIEASAALVAGTSPEAHVRAVVAGGERPFVIRCKVIKG